MYQYGIWERGPDFESLGQHLHFSLFYFGPHALGTQYQAPTPSFSFNFFYLYFLFLFRGVVDRTSTTPFYFNFFFHGFFELTMRLLDRTPTASLYFSFNLPFPPRGRGSDSHASHLFSFHFFLTLTKRFWVRIPLLSFLIFIHHFPAQFHGSNPLHHISFYFFIFMVFNMVRSRVQSSMTSLF